MKKEYKTPTMKVRKIHCSHMLCGSTFGITREEVDKGKTIERYGSEYDDGAW